MKKKVISAMIIMTMMTGLLAGCGKSSGSEADKESGGKKKVTVWAWDVEYNIPVMEEAAKRYEEKHSDVDIEVMEYAYDDITQKINTNLSSGITDGLPEIILSEDANVQKYLQSYPGEFLDMQDKVDFDNFADYKVQVLSLDGGIYGVPFDIGTEGFFYRKDYMDQAGITEDQLTDITWNQYIEIGKKVKEATGKDMMTLDPNSMTIMRDFMQSSGTWYFTEDGSVNIADNPVIEEGANIYKSMMDNGIIKLTTGWGEMAAALNNGDVASIVSGCWIVPTITAQEEQSGLWRVTRMPRLNVEGGTNYGNRGGSNWLVLKNSENAEIAADFLNEVFANDVDFYDTILTDIGAIGAYKPAQSSEAYSQGVEFFGGETIWKNFAEWAQSVPPIRVGVYSDEADTVLISGMSEVVNGTKAVPDMLKEAEKLLKQQIDQ
ncbi:ABC transporter substrate-binding protein [Faecalicatena contorta]|uniref:Lactose-binding protein n=1 Tax=Faecalicatena contorta TaxID=39482 RepID=A0A315ZYA0_9FIRM|nr:extracellular solute-binding protein [Faecalicatena contorta]PWJ50465.1 lactose-binding protein [Faecalicatena contorta]SUQ13873.1 lactose-binding protein [Faecalicatena contorta]